MCSLFFLLSVEEKFNVGIKVEEQEIVAAKKILECLVHTQYWLLKETQDRLFKSHFLTYHQ